MKKSTNCDLYLERQMRDPEVRGLVDKELASLRRCSQMATARQKKQPSKAQRAVRVRKRSS